MKPHSLNQEAPEVQELQGWCCWATCQCNTSRVVKPQVKLQPCEVAESCVPPVEVVIHNFNHQLQPSTLELKSSRGCVPGLSRAPRLRSLQHEPCKTSGLVPKFHQISLKRIEKTIILFKAFKSNSTWKRFILNCCFQNTTRRLPPWRCPEIPRPVTDTSRLTHRKLCWPTCFSANIWRSSFLFSASQREKHSDISKSAVLLLPPTVEPVLPDGHLTLGVIQVAIWEKVVLQGHKPKALYVLWWTSKCQWYFRSQVFLSNFSFSIFRGKEIYTMGDCWNQSLLEEPKERASECSAHFQRYTATLQSRELDETLLRSTLNFCILKSEDGFFTLQALNPAWIGGSCHNPLWWEDDQLGRFPGKYLCQLFLMFRCRLGTRQPTCSTGRFVFPIHFGNLELQVAMYRTDSPSRTIPPLPRSESLLFCASSNEPK